VSSKLEGVTLIGTRAVCRHGACIHRIPLNSSKYIMSFNPICRGSSPFRKRGLMARYLVSRITNPAAAALSLVAFCPQKFSGPARRQSGDRLLTEKASGPPPEHRCAGTEDAMAQDTAQELVLTFVGAHFGRKGGCVAVKIAEKAIDQNLPIQVNIVSSLQVGGHIWTDPTSPGFFDPYISCLN